MEGNKHQRKFYKKKFYIRLSKQITQKTPLFPCTPLERSKIFNSIPSFTENLTDSFISQSSTQTSFSHMPSSIPNTSFLNTFSLQNSEFLFANKIGGEKSLNIPQKRLRKVEKLSTKVMNKIVDVKDEIVLMGGFERCEGLEVEVGVRKRSERFLEKIRERGKGEKVDYTLVKGFLGERVEDGELAVQVPRNMEGFTMRRPLVSSRDLMLETLRTQINSRKTIHLEYEQIFSKPTTDLQGYKKQKLCETPSTPFKSFSIDCKSLKNHFFDTQKNDPASDSVSTLDSSPAYQREFDSPEKNQTQLFEDKTQEIDLSKDFYVSDQIGLQSVVKNLINEFDCEEKVEIVDEEEEREMRRRQERKKIEFIRKIKTERRVVDGKGLGYLELISGSTQVRDSDLKRPSFSRSLLTNPSIFHKEITDN